MDREKQLDDIEIEIQNIQAIIEIAQQNLLILLENRDVLINEKNNPIGFRK